MARARIVYNTLGLFRSSPLLQQGLVHWIPASCSPFNRRISTWRHHPPIWFHDSLLNQPAHPHLQAGTSCGPNALQSPSHFYP